MTGTAKVKTIQAHRDAGMSIREAAAYLGCSRTTLLEHIDAGLVQWYPIGVTGKHRRITRAACDELRDTLRHRHDPGSKDQVLFATENPYDGEVKEYLRNIGL